MPTQPAAKVKVATGVSLTQRIALLFVVMVGIIVVGSVAVAAIFTWSTNEFTVNERQTARGTQSPSVLGEESTDYTFEITGPSDN